jgi:hypothetical protein
MAIRFAAGVTTADLELVEALGERELGRALTAHLEGRWGEASPAEVAENEEAIRRGHGEVVSRHRAHGVAFVVVTAADRTRTALRRA